MIRRLPAALAVLLVAVLALGTGCTTAPRPFAGSGEALPPVTGAAVIVPPVQGAPAAVAEALAAAVAEGLSRQEIPARVGPGAPGEHRVIASVLDLRPVDADDRILVALGLELRDGDGRPVLVQQVRGGLPGALWTAEAVDPDALTEAARALVAPALPRLAAAEQALVPIPEAEPLGLAEGVAPPPPDALSILPAVEVLPVTGAPGGASNNTLMAQAARSVLRQTGVPVSRTASDAGAAVAAIVTIAPAVEGRERIAVTWTVMTPEGHEIGTVNQENMLPAGYAQQQWADLSYLIAAAAVDGIVPLLRRIQAGEGNGGPAGL